MLIRLGFVSVLLGSSQAAWAAGGVLIQPIVSLDQGTHSESNRNGNETYTVRRSENSTWLQLNVGAFVSEQIFVGARILSLSANLKEKWLVVPRNDDWEIITDYDAQVYGAAVGWVGSSFFLVGSYVVAGEGSFTRSDETQTWLKPAGYTVDAGIMIEAGSVRFGPVVTTTSIEFKEAKVDSTTLPVSPVIDQVIPGIGLLFTF